jgi:hypothetical protein
LAQAGRAFTAREYVKVKFSHRDQLLGFVATNEYILANEVLCKSLHTFNIYERSDAFLDGLEGGRTAYVDQMTFIDWLCQERCVDRAELKKTKNKQTFRRYRNYPKMPTSREVFQTVGKLSKVFTEAELEKFSTMDIFILTVVDDDNVPWLGYVGTGLGHADRSETELLKSQIRRCGMYLRGLEDTWREVYEDVVLAKSSIKKP